MFDIIFRANCKTEKVTKQELIYLIKKSIRTGNTVFINLDDKHKRMIIHNTVLHRPLKKLPGLLSKLQEFAYEFKVSEIEGEEVVKSKNYSFNQMDIGINKALEGVNEGMEILM